MAQTQILKHVNLFSGACASVALDLWEERVDCSQLGSGGTREPLLRNDVFSRGYVEQRP